MRNAKVIAVALMLVLGVACKKKKKDEAGGNMAGTGSSMAGTGAGTGSDMAGSDTMAGSGAGSAEEPKKELVNWAAADIKWGPMDPANPDAAPQIAPLWGDMQNEANGSLLKVKAGSKGMWHTHTGDYHGIVITGSPNHLQAGDKKPVLLPPGSYWFEPGGIPHNSQCLGKEDCLVLVHFNEGKMDFAPAEEPKGGKRDAKYVEKLAKDIKFTPLMPDTKDGPQIADVWGDAASGPHGRFWKFPGGFASPPHSHTVDYHAVVLKGTIMNHTPDDKAPKEMGPGSYWMQPGGVDHITACKAGSECLAYSYTLGKFDFTPAEGGGDAGSAAGSGDMKGEDKK